MIKYCRNCGKMAEADGEIKFCPHCGASMEEPLTPDEKQSEIPPERETLIYKAPDETENKYILWEDRSKLGFISSLFETWKESVFNPTRFYRKMPATGGIGNPLLYGLIFGFIGLVFSMVYQQFFSQLFDPSPWYQYMGQDFDRDLYDFSRQMESISHLFQIVLFPFMLTAWFFIWAGILHLIMTIFNWKSESFEATFRIITYSEGPSFFAIVPVIGSLIAIIWQLVLVIIGLKEVHKNDIGKAILIVFLPLILCCLCCCGFSTFLFGLIGASN
ncbi:MAG: YIP1 family protein [candidate division Zixibacteria bacterium]|nr:YIP1 family protein [candidate division Zixibacteria bacterium]